MAQRKSTFAGYSREEYCQVVQYLAECWHRWLSVGTDKATIVDSQFTTAGFYNRGFRARV